MARVVLGEFKPTYNERRAEQSRYLDQLASGQRITQPGVDAASLAIGSLLNSQSAVLSVAASNASTGQALLNVASGGLDAASGILEQLKSLATFAQSGSLTEDDRTTINNQFISLKNELDAVSATTSFGGKKLLDGSFTGVNVALGTGNAIGIDFTSTSSAALGLNATDLLNTDNTDAALSAIDSAIATITGDQSELGATQAQFAFSAAVIATSKENTQASLSTLLDSDAGESFTAQASASALNQATIASIENANASRRYLLALLQ